MRETLEQRIDACERENARLRRSIHRQNLLWPALALVLMLGTGFTLSSGAHSSRTSGDFDSIRAREIVVVDDRGTIRARLAGTMPDAVIGGKVVARGDRAAGVMLYDDTGQERGGYVTFDSGNVALTLDTRKRQVALFAAGPDGGAAAEVWSETGGHRVGLRADELGARLTATKGGRVVQQSPVVTLSAEICSAYTDPALPLTRERRLSECNTRFLEAQCTACLDAAND